IIQMSSRAPSGGSIALRTRCTRRSLLVTVPSDSHHDAVPGSTTSATLAVSVITMSWTTRHSRPSSILRVWCVSASELTGFSQMTQAQVSSPRSIASNICDRCRPFLWWTGTPYLAPNRLRASASSSMSWKPASLLGIAPMSGEQGQVNQREDVVRRVVVLGDAERPADLRAVRLGVVVGELPDQLL